MGGERITDVVNRMQEERYFEDPRTERLSKKEKSSRLVSKTHNNRVHRDKLRKQRQGQLLMGVPKKEELLVKLRPGVIQP